LSSSDFRDGDPAAVYFSTKDIQLSDDDEDDDEGDDEKIVDDSHLASWNHHHSLYRTNFL
jgi:hypothetical protein